jgi:hypothetical protein
MSDTPDFESKAEYIRRMADDGTGALEDVPGIEANISASVEDVAQVVTDVADLPNTTTIRLNGTFSDASDLHEYLEAGGLVVTDGSGNTEPIGFVWVLEEFDDILYQTMYQVYIDEDTN